MALDQYWVKVSILVDGSSPESAIKYTEGILKGTEMPPRDFCIWDATKKKGIKW